MSSRIPSQTSNGVKNVFVFGNPDLEFDSLAIRILPKLKKRFPALYFAIKDPHEELDLGEEFLIIDTVEGISDVTIFPGLEKFAASPSLTLHDFDVYASLRFAQKINKLPPIKIVGIPPGLPEDQALRKTSEALRRIGC